MAGWLRKIWNRLRPGAPLGRLGERVAARHLKGHGLKILARNVRVGHGEIDLIAREGSTLVFVEVKSRSWGARDEVTGLERLDASKLRALRRSCLRSLKKAPAGIDGYRLDAVTVEFVPGLFGPRAREVRWYPAVAALHE